MSSANDAVLGFAVERLQDGHPVALVTLVKTWGSAPVPVGTQMAVCGEADFNGAVSGGCVEDEIAASAVAVLADGIPLLATIEIANTTAWAVGLPSGGEVTVFVERLQPSIDMDFVNALSLSSRERSVIVWQTDVSSGARRFRRFDDQRDGFETFGSLTGGQPARVISREGSETFECIQRPMPRLLIVGATRMAQVLSQLALAMGASSIVIDPRESYANPDRFPVEDYRGVEVIHGEPGDVIPQLGLDQFTGLAALAHVSDIDDPALKLAVASPAIYIGVLGSTRNHTRRRARFMGQGMSTETFERIRCPIGLDIGAATPAEIALAIMAEFVLALRGETRTASLAKAI